MPENKEEYYSLRDIVGQANLYFKFLSKGWWLLVLVLVAGTGIGMIYFHLQKPKYEAVTTFILEEKSGGSGGLSGLASQFGFDIGSLNSGGSIFSGDNILNILKSKKVVEKVLVSSISDTTPNDKTLADSYLEFSGLKRQWRKIPVLQDVHFRIGQTQLSPIQDSVINIIYDEIVNKELVTDRASKQGSIIKVEVTAPDAAFARLMSQRLVDEASKLYLNVRIGTAQENINRLERRADSLLLLLNNKSYNTAVSQQLDVNPGVRTAIVPVEIANRDKNVLATLYLEITKNLETSKVLLSQQTPVIQLLDRPGYLLNDHKKRMLVLCLIGIFSSAVIYLLVAFAIFWMQRMNSRA